MKRIEMLTREEFEKAGFVYEPDKTKCKAYKLRLYVPGPEILATDEYKQEIIKQIPFVYVHEVIDTPNPYEGDPSWCCDPKVLVVGHTRMENNMNISPDFICDSKGRIQQTENNMKASPSWNGTENLIQNFCVTFTHNFNHRYSRFKNSFVIKGAPVTKENALKIAEILFPDHTDIEIESIGNDENTLTPSEYDFLKGMLKDKQYSRKVVSERRREKDPELAKSWDESKSQQEYDKYLEALIKKMEARMDQFPVYHT